MSDGSDTTPPSSLTVEGVKCGFCIQVPRHSYGGGRGCFPELTEQLQPSEQSQTHHSLLRCPECGDWYSLREWSEDRGHYWGYTDYASLDRLSPTEAYDRLKGPDFEAWSESYDVRLQRSRAGLGHPEASVQRESAWELARHGILFGEPDGLRALLEDASGTVRAETLRTLEKAVKCQEAIDLPVLAVALERLVEHSGVELGARWLLAQADAQDSSGGKLRQRLRSEEAHELQPALQALADAVVAQRSWASSHLPRARELIRHESSEVRDSAALVLERAVAAELDVEATYACICTLLRDADEDIAEQGVSLAKDLLRGGQSIAPLLDDLLPLFRLPGAHFHLVKMFQMLSTTAEVEVLNRWFRGLALGLWTMEAELAMAAMTWAGDMVQRGADLEILVPALAQDWVHRGEDTEAALLTLRAAEQGLDISEALPPVRAVGFSESESWARPIALKILVAVLIHQEDIEGLRGLIADEREHVRKDALNALNDLALKGQGVDLTELEGLLVHYLDQESEVSKYAGWLLRRHVGDSPERARRFLKMAKGKLRTWRTLEAECKALIE